MRNAKRQADLLASLPGVVWEAWSCPDSAQQRIHFVSDYVETMLGYTAAEWLATPDFWLTIVHPEDRARIAQDAALLFHGGKGGTSQFRWVRKDGHLVWADSHVVVVCDEAGTPIGLRGVTLDVTGRKETESDLKNAQKELVAISRAAGMADVATSVLHNVGNVLNSVNVSIGVAADKAAQLKVADRLSSISSTIACRS